VRAHFENWGHEEVIGYPGELDSRWTVRHVNHMVLERWLPTEGKVLDAGRGHGIEAIRMAQRGLLVTALDISSSLLRHARRRAEMTGMLDRISFVRADLTDPLPLPPDSFGTCIALTGVLGHAGLRHKDALANLVTCCRPGGLVIVGVGSYYGRIRQYLHEGRLAAAEHLAETHLTHTVSATFEDYYFKPNELRDALGALGCQILEMVAAPAVAAYGYVGAEEKDFARALALERCFLGNPELVGAGEHIVGVFRKGSLGDAT
jgi:SAM-dependent methyltransferase